MVDRTRGAPGASFSHAAAEDFREGDLVNIRARALIDGGSDVQVLIEGPRLRKTFWVPRATLSKLLT